VGDPFADRHTTGSVRGSGAVLVTVPEPRPSFAEYQKQTRADEPGTCRAFT
jgi:hypothetical protein